LAGHNGPRTAGSGWGAASGFSPGPANVARVLAHNVATAPAAAYKNVKTGLMPRFCNNALPEMQVN
jgi:hypothetical protein